MCKTLRRNKRTLITNSVSDNRVAKLLSFDHHSENHRFNVTIISNVKIALIFSIKVYCFRNAMLLGIGVNFIEMTDWRNPNRSIY